MKTTSNVIAVSVHPAVKEFILSTVGSEVIEPIPNSNFYNKVVSFMESKNLKRTGKKYRFVKYETIGLKLPDHVIRVNTTSNNLQWLIGEQVYEGFKEIYVNYVFAYIRGGGNVQMIAIKDFCSIYGINASKETLKTLKNVWDNAKMGMN